MANPFGDEAVDTGEPNPFGDQQAPEGDSYLTASAKSGVHAAAAATAKALDSALSMVGLGTTEEEAAVLFKDDPEGFKRWKASAAGGLTNAAEQEQKAANAAVAPENLTAHGQHIAGKQYATTDTGNAAYLSPERIAGDALQSLPSSAIMVGAGILTRGAARTAYQEALASGATEAAARAAAMRAGAEAMSTSGAAAEGVVGAAQQATQTRVDVDSIPQSVLEQMPEYQNLLKAGFTPETARAKLSAATANEAGLGAGLADVTMSALGGHFLGRVIGEGGKIIPRIAKGAVTEGLTEAVQSPLEQISQNTAVQANMNPFQDPLEGAAEAAVAGGVVGAATGGALSGIAGHGIEQVKQRADTLSKVADELELQATTGGTSAENDMAANAPGQRDAKPRLSPVQSRIVTGAAAKGVDPATALTIAHIESRFNPNAQNPNSTAHGLFQQTDANWAASGGGDRGDIGTQITNGLTSIAQTQAALEAKLGRVPSTEETYVGHLFGPSGGAQAILASQSDPQGSFLETVKRWAPRDAKAILQNNGIPLDATNEFAVNKVYGMVTRAQQEIGLQPAVNEEYNAGASADDVPNPYANEPELADLDAMFRAEEESALTPEEVDAALREDEARAVELKEEPSSETELLDQETAPEEEGTEPARPVLPRELAGASPRYGIGQQSWPVHFENDLDRAAYIIANNAKRSARDAEYLAFVMENTGMSEDEARRYGRDVRESIRELARSALNKPDVSTLHLPDLRDTAGPVAARAESSVSLDEQTTRGKYRNPNDAYMRRPSAAPIVAANVPEAVGQPLSTYSVAPGEVVAVGEDSRHTPRAYMEAAQQTVQEAIRRFAPTARVVLTFGTEAPGVVSSFRARSAIGNKLRAARGRGLYHINLRNATSFGLRSDGTANVTTQQKIVYATWHEIGHVIADEQMTRGMSPALREKFENMGEEGYFTEEELATLPPDSAAVLREYNDLKWRALNDPAFTAREWAEAWLSPWKLAHGWGAKQGLFSYVKMYLGQSWVQRLDEPAAGFARALHESGTDILSPHEYMAEQMARYAYTNKLDVGTSLGARNFFRNAIESMRQFFRKLKGERAVPPGTAFAEWLDSLTALHEGPQEVDLAPVSEAAQGSQEVKAAKPRIKKLKTQPSEVQEISLLPAAETKVEKASRAADPVYSAEQLQALQFLAGDLRYLAQTRPAKYQQYMDLIRADRVEDFKTDVELTQPEEVVARIRFDRDLPEDAGALEWRDVEHNFVKAVPVRATVKRWLPNGIRKIREKVFALQTLRQAAFAHPEVAGLAALNIHSLNMKAFKAKLEMPAIEATQMIAKLGKEQYGLLERAVRDEAYNGQHFAELQLVNQTWRLVPGERLAAYAQEKGLNEQTVRAWLAMKNAHLSQLNALHNVIRQKMLVRYKNRPKMLQVKLKELAQTVQDIRSKPFLPQTRFGEYALHVKEMTPDGMKVVHVEMFGSRSVRDEAIGQLRKIVGTGRKVEEAQYSLTSSILRTLPPQLLGTWADEMALTPSEKAEIKRLSDYATASPYFRKYSAKLAAITGANGNMLRNFAEFSMHNANNISKLHYREHLERAVLAIDADRIAAAGAGNGELHDELATIEKYAKKYVDHILSPTDEFQAIRTFVIWKQLAFSVKTAVLNLVSMEQVWALAMTQQGVVKGTARTIGDSLKVAQDGLTKAMQRVMRQPVEGAQVWSADTKWALDQAKTEGFLEEGFASQIASFANAGVLQRLNMGEGERWIKQATWLGMQPMHIVDSFVRRVSFVNQFELALKSGMAKEKAYVKARDETFAQLGDNSQANRPEFMRGKAALFTIYYSFMQQMLYLFSGAPERARNLRDAIESGQANGLTSEQAKAKFHRIKFGGETMKLWAIHLVLGGMMGLPGADDLDKILELVSAKLFGHRFSLKEQAYAFAATIAEEAHSFGVDLNPRSLVHGTTSDLNFFGLAPHIDVSSSVGLGQALPGSGGVQHLGDKDKAKAILGFAGPVGSVASQFFDLFGDDPSMAKRFGFFLPNFASNAIKAQDAWEHGVRDPSGGRITIDRQTGEVRDLTTGEKLANLMGFQPSIVTANKELYWMQRDAATYWTTRRNALTTQMFEARLQGDREAVADTMQALRDFNEQAPRGMQLHPAQLFRTLKQKSKTMREHELQRGAKSERALNQELRANFDGPGGQ